MEWAGLGWAGLGALGCFVRCGRGWDLRRLGARWRALCALRALRWRSLRWRIHSANPTLDVPAKGLERNGSA